MKKIVLVIAVMTVLVASMFAQGMHRKGMMKGEDCGMSRGGMMQHKGMKGAGMHHNGMHRDRMMMCINRLELTDKQEKEIRDIRDTHKKAANLKRAEIKNLEMDMHKYMKDAEFKKAAKISEQLTEAKGDIHLSRIKMMEDVYSKLTDEQKQEFKEMKPMMRKGMRGCNGDDCGDCDDK